MKEVSSFDSISRKKIKIDKYKLQPVLAFLLSLFFLNMLLLIGDFIPFGSQIIMYSDLKAQHAPYLMRLKEHMGDVDWSSFISSFTYDASFGGGKNIMSTFGYYMASPLNFLVFFFDADKVDYLVMLLLEIKLACASAFMCLFLNKRATVRSAWPIVFGTAYAFTAYAMAYCFHIIWFDAYALLPLFLFFIEIYLERSKKLGMMIVLMLLFISNFYMSYMVGVFSFFYLVVRLIDKVVLENSLKAKNAVKTACKFVLIAVICVLLVSPILVPVIVDTLQNRDVIVSTSRLEVLNFKLIDMVDQIFLGMTGTFSDIMIDNLPFVFCGLSVTFLITLSFCTRVFTAKERIRNGILLGLVFLSFVVEKIDMVWHAFDDPNWFNHRYSFVFIPFFLLVALKTVERIKEISNREICKAGGILLVLLIIAESFGTLGSDSYIILLNVVFIVVYALLFMAIKIEKWPSQLRNMPRLSVYILVLVITVECCAVAPRQAGGVSAFMDRSSISSEYEADIRAIKQLANRDEAGRTGFRTELEAGQYYKGYMDEGEEISSLLGINGISLFDSNSNKNFARFRKQLGFKTNYNYFSSSYEAASLPVDVFFSIGDIYTSEEYFNADLIATETTQDDYYFYQNDYVLPMAFPVDEGARSFNFYQLETQIEYKDYFSFQNQWYKSMFKNEFVEDFYHSRKVNDEEISLFNCQFAPVKYMSSAFDPIVNRIDTLGNEDQVVDEGDRHVIVRESRIVPMIMEVSTVADYSGEYYIVLSTNEIVSTATIEKNNETLTDLSSMFSTIIRVGYYDEGDKIDFVINSDYNYLPYLDIYIASLDSEVFRDQISKVDTSNVEIDTFENGHIVINTDLKEDQMLLTSVPYAKGWTCYIDGEKTDIEPYQDALLAADCGTGQHKVEFVFKAPGTDAGIVLSIIGLLSAGGLGVYDVLQNKKKKVAQV